VRISNGSVNPPADDAIVLNDIKGAEFNNVKAQKAADVPTFVLKDVSGFRTYQCTPTADTTLDRVEQKEL